MEMAKFRERVEEWQTTLTGLQTSIAELSQKLASVEGHADLSPQVAQLETALAEAKAELAELKEAKPTMESEPEKKTEPEPKPPASPKRSTRKQSLTERLSRKSGADLPEPKIREPRRKLTLI
jgi:chromosome segregation ATPase